jgi:hypothetical protein
MVSVISCTPRLLVAYLSVSFFLFFFMSNTIYSKQHTKRNASAVSVLPQRQATHPPPAGWIYLTHSSILCFDLGNRHYSPLDKQEIRVRTRPPTTISNLRTYFCSSTRISVLLTFFGGAVIIDTDKTSHSSLYSIGWPWMCPESSWFEGSELNYYHYFNCIHDQEHAKVWYQHIQHDSISWYQSTERCVNLDSIQLQSNNVPFFIKKFDKIDQ